MNLSASWVATGQQFLFASAPLDLLLSIGSIRPSSPCGGRSRDASFLYRMRRFAGPTSHQTDRWIPSRTAAQFPHASLHWGERGTELGFHLPRPPPPPYRANRPDPRFAAAAAVMGTERKRMVSLFDVVDESSVSTKLGHAGTTNSTATAAANPSINWWTGRPYSARYLEIL
ncbi:Os08g0199900 [Oryza sativa Japonica Group]|uniref:Os08g0199900 protein n=1 Tax=Oryza sativa subsp. japonica TaxID=39947 RepID=A0A0P0XCN7_ORYSJ|nr:Os08g0199900 [Oryza sativa Japonica Group]